MSQKEEAVGGAGNAPTADTKNHIWILGDLATARKFEHLQARTALAECHRVDEVKDIRDKAEAMAAYARQAKDTELIQYATEIKVRAERRCGELLARTEKNRGAATPSDDTRASPPTLKKMGLTYDESSRYQQLAAMPAEHFETAVATVLTRRGAQ
jgi:hypothetical protein